MNRFSTSLALAGLAVAAPALAAQESSTHRLAGPRVAIYNLVGEITLRAGSGSEVTVAVAPTGRDAARLRVATGEIRGLNTLRVLYPEDRIAYPGHGRRWRTQFQIRDDGTWGDIDGRWGRDRGDRRIEIGGEGRGMEAAANLTISVPEGRMVAVFLGVGRVEATNVSGNLYLDGAAAELTATGIRGDLTLDTGSGRVEARDITGSLNIDTGSGDVRVDGVRNGSLKVDTGSGAVTGNNLTVTDVNIDTGSGEIDLQNLTTPRIKCDTGSGSVRLALVRSPEVVDVETGSGSVHLRLPEPVNATVDLETGSGGFTVDFPVQLVRKGDSSLRGRIGDGSGRIQIETGSGDISIVK